MPRRVHPIESEDIDSWLRDFVPAREREQAIEQAPVPGFGLDAPLKQRFQTEPRGEFDLLREHRKQTLADYETRRGPQPPHTTPGLLDKFIEPLGWGVQRLFGPKPAPPDLVPPMPTKVEPPPAPPPMAPEVPPMAPAMEAPAPSLAPPPQPPPPPSKPTAGSYDPIIDQTAQKYGVDPNLVRAVMQQESGGRERALSPKGALGLMQLMPKTAAELGVQDPFNPEQNIEGGTKYLGQLLKRYNGDVPQALAAYNFGMGNVETGREWPAETQQYVARIMGRYQPTPPSVQMASAPAATPIPTPPAIPGDTVPEDVIDVPEVVIHGERDRPRQPPPVLAGLVPPIGAAPVPPPAEPPPPPTFTAPPSEPAPPPMLSAPPRRNEWDLSAFTDVLKKSWNTGLQSGLFTLGEIVDATMGGKGSIHQAAQDRQAVVGQHNALIPQRTPDVHPIAKAIYDLAASRDVHGANPETILEKIGGGAAQFTAEYGPQIAAIGGLLSTAGVAPGVAAIGAPALAGAVKGFEVSPMEGAKNAALFGIPGAVGKLVQPFGPLVHTAAQTAVGAGFGALTGEDWRDVVAMGLLFGVPTAAMEGVAAKLNQAQAKGHAGPDPAAALRAFGLDETATEAQVKTAFRDQVKIMRPDLEAETATAQSAKTTQFMGLMEQYQAALAATRGRTGPPSLEAPPRPEPTAPPLLPEPVPKVGRAVNERVAAVADQLPREMDITPPAAPFLKKQAAPTIEAPPRHLAELPGPDAPSMETPPPSIEPVPAPKSGQKSLMLENKPAEFPPLPPSRATSDVKSEQNEPAPPSIREKGPEAPAVFAGYQGGSKNVPGFELFNLTESIPGHPKDSTVSRQTLEQAGYLVPPADPTTVPRSTLPEAQNVEMQLRAEKAKADLDSSFGSKAGYGFEPDVGPGTGEKSTWASANADWYKEITTGKRPLDRETVDRAVEKIIQDQGIDHGKAVQRVKEAILADREFQDTPWGRDFDAVMRGETPEYLAKEPPALEAPPKATEPEPPSLELTPPSVVKAKRPAPEQQTMPGLEPPTIGETPKIAREAQPEEAPLFSKAAKEAEPEQTELTPPQAAKPEPADLTPPAPKADLPGPTTARSPEAYKRRQELQAGKTGIPLTEMAPADAKNWVGYTGQPTITVYRGGDVNRPLERGDYVTTSKDAAQAYGKHVTEMKVPATDLRYVRGHINGDPKLLDVGGSTELIYAPAKAKPAPSAPPPKPEPKATPAKVVVKESQVPPPLPRTVGRVEETIPPPVKKKPPLAKRATPAAEPVTVPAEVPARSPKQLADIEQQLLKQSGRHLTPDERGSVPLGRAKLPDVEDTTPPVAFPEESEARYQAAKTALAQQPGGLISSVRDSLTKVAHGMSREYPDLPNTPQYANIHEHLRQLQAAPTMAKDRTIRLLDGLVTQLGAKRFDLFTRKVILDDLAYEAERGHDLPFGLTKDTLASAKTAVDAATNDVPAVQQALAQRQALMDSVRTQLVDAGLLSKEADNPAYFHHQVLDYARLRAQGRATELTKPSPGYAKQREGSLKDINANYLEAEFEYLHRALIDLKTAETLKKVEKDPVNIRPRLEAEAKQARTADPAAKKTWRDLVPEGYRLWQPDKGNVFFSAQSVSERALKELHTRLLDPEVFAENPKIADALKGFEGQLKDVLAIGGKKHEIVIPEELATTLDKLRPAVDDSFWSAVFTKPQSGWKQWVLINPHRWAKYNINNASGDLDAVIAGNWRVLKEVPRATVEMWRIGRGQMEPTARYLEAVERGIFDSGLTIQEIPEINLLPQFQRLQPGSFPTPKRMAQTIWNVLKDTTQFRENMLRYAAYRWYADAVEKGQKVPYGGSRPELIDALTDPKDKAAKLSRELLVDYGAISAFGKEIRSRVMPFYSWMEGNTVRYIRLVDNAFKQGIGEGVKSAGVLGAGAVVKGGIKTAWALASLGTFYSAMNLFNTLFHPDEEAELSTLEQNRLHLNLGKDDEGEIRTLRFQGALSDFLEWVGFSEIMPGLREIEAGRATPKDLIKTMVKAPLNKVAQGITPVIKTPVELIAGRSFFPDVLNSRPIDDRTRHLLRLFSLENEYDVATGKPRRSYPETLELSVISKRDPAEIAYQDTRALKEQWLERQGYERGFGQSPNSQLLRDWKRAIKLKDQEAIDRLKPQVEKLEPRAYQASLASLQPLAGLSAERRKEFLKTLNPKERARLEVANKYYKDLFASGNIGDLPYKLKPHKPLPYLPRDPLVPPPTAP